MSLPFLVREPYPEETGYIRKTWREALYRDSAMVSGADREHYTAEMGRVFDRLMPEGGSTVRVAVDKKDDSLIVGFVCRTGPELHFVYVMDGLRNQGIVPLMLEGRPIDSYTFRTQMFERRIRKKRPGLKFTPRFSL